ncbi:uncharacterized protein LOC114119067 [Aphis gossypii]|uniref:Uncharacterized protein n=1 Tax=Aphis gossypii TaxID=80765 RepID=A0A9P0NL50_APHGO|nr:uncharacterized protein LOC114119067 [Aphis gossypii]CAH1724588.1 unnamed protein product [Aphis gossypii]
MYLLPYVILKIILLTSTVAEPMLEILLTAENGQTLTNVDQSNSANDDEKTLAQQIFEGKYGLIHKELFNDIPSKPGILSYNINPEVPKDNINNLGGLDPDEIWLAENHLLVLRGGNFSDKKVKWAYIDNYVAPLRQVKIPENPKIPPPFPIQLEDNGPIDFVSINGSTWNPVFPPPFPSNQGPPLPNTTFDEDDQSLFYPPKYDFIYTLENSTRVPPGPLVPGIVLPPPPNFFGPLEKPEKAKKINLNLNKTIPRFNQKPYFKIPKGNHNNKENGWVPIPSIKPSYIEGLKIKNNILITTTESSNKYNSNYNEQINFPSHQFFIENPAGHTTSQPDSYYYYQENNKYDVEKPAEHNKYEDSKIKSQQFDFQNNYEKSTTIKPYYEYSYVAPEYDIKSQIQNPIHKQKQMTEYQKERHLYQEWVEKPKHTQYNNNEMEKQKYQTWPQQNNQYSDIDYGYQTEKPNIATDNPYHAFFTQDDASLVDENTKKYFALFGQKVRTEKPTQVSSQSKSHTNKNDNKISIIDDILVNFKQPLQTKNPESEITTVKPQNNYPQISLHDDISVNFKEKQPQINTDAEIISQNSNDFKENYPYSIDGEINYNQYLPPKSINNDKIIKKPFVQTSLHSNTPVNNKQPLLSKNPNLEPITQRPFINVHQPSLYDDTQVNYKQPIPPINLNSEIITQIPLYKLPSLFEDTNVNFKLPSRTENPNSEQITKRPHTRITQSPKHENINYNLDSSFVTQNPNSEHVTQQLYMQISQTPYYSDTTMNNKHHKQSYPSNNLNIEQVTQKPYINVPESLVDDGIRVNFKPQRYSNNRVVTQKPYIKVSNTQHLEEAQINYQQAIFQQNPNTETEEKRPRIKFPQTPLIDNAQFHFKRPLPMRNHDTEYYTQKPKSIYSQTPVSLIDDIQVNYKHPLPTKNIDSEYIVSTQEPLNRVVSYNLPGNSGSHFFFLTTHTGHPIQYNLGNHNYQYYKRNVK